MARGPKRIYIIIYVMSITWGVLAQSPEPEAHDKVLDNYPDRIGIWKCWFLRRGENRSTRRKTSRSKDENQQQTQPTYGAESVNGTRAAWWEACVGGKCSTTAPCIPSPLSIELRVVTIQRIKEKMVYSQGGKLKFIQFN